MSKRTTGAQLKDGTRLQVTYTMGGEGTFSPRTRAGVVLPSAFDVLVEGGAAGPYQVQLRAEVQQRVLRCAAVTVRQLSDGPPVKNAGMRIAVDYLLQEAAALVAVKVTSRQSGFTVQPVGVEGEQAVRQALKTPRRRQPVDDDALRAAADAWRLHKHRRDRTLAAAESLGLSRTTFDRHRRLARERGFLEEQA
jgi:hypothetical protein